jgi:hypothetical protein
VTYYTDLFHFQTTIFSKLIDLNSWLFLPPSGIRVLIFLALQFTMYISEDFLIFCLKIFFVLNLLVLGINVVFAINVLAAINVVTIINLSLLRPYMMKVKTLSVGLKIEIYVDWTLQIPEMFFTLKKPCRRFYVFGTWNQCKSSYSIGVCLFALIPRL